MSDIRNISKEFLTEFLAIYRSHPSLWKVKSKEFVNKNLKNAGYDELVEYYKKQSPNADRDLVSKKIQSMRGSFRKELKKYEAWKKSGESADTEYVPSLWYFDLLMFTRDQELPTDSLDSVQNSPSSDAADDGEIEDVRQDEFNSIEDECSVGGRGDKGVDAAEGGSNIFKKPEPKKCRKRPTSTISVLTPGQENLMNACAAALKQDRTDPESDAFGQLIAAKHAKLSAEQKMYAEMLISSVLNRGILNRLTENTAITENSSMFFISSPTSISSEPEIMSQPDASSMDSPTENGEFLS